MSLTDNVDTSPRAVRKFGLLFTAVSVVLAALLAYRGHASAWPWALAAGGFFLLSGLFVQPVLRPLYVVWMKFAFVLGWINTRLILGLFFYVILTPGSVLMRLFGRDVLKRKPDPAARSYWIPRENPTFDRQRYEKLF